MTTHTSQQAASPGLTTKTPFSLASYREIETARGVAWSATIKRNGTQVGVVSNEGCGGCNDYRFTSPAEHEEFAAQAKTLYPDEVFEVEDRFTDDLATLAQMSRRRGHVFFVDGDNVDMGEFRMFPAKYTVAQIVDVLANSPKFAPLHPMLLDKTEKVFKPVA